MEKEMVSYAHKSSPRGQRFCQYKKDPLPAWAVDVRPHDPNSSPASSSMSYDEQIKASHPTRCNLPDVWKAEEMALKLVGERHEKRDLVNLVRWLILDNAKMVGNDL